MNSVFFLDDSSSSSSTSTSSSSSSQDGRGDESRSLAAKRRWQAVEAHAKALPLARLPFISTASAADSFTNSRLLDQDAVQAVSIAKKKQEMSFQAALSAAKSELAVYRQGLEQLVAKFVSAKRANHLVLANVQVPLLCLSDKTKSMLVSHVQHIEKYYVGLLHRMDDAKPLSVKEYQGLLNCNASFVDTFCRQVHNDTDAPRHAIFWLHGPAGLGKTSWVKSFWHGWLGVNTRIWTHHAASSYSVEDVCASLVQFFDNAMIDASVPQHHSLVPIVLSNLDTTFEMYQDKQASVLYAYVMQLLMQYSSSSESSLGTRQKFLVVYITCSSKSTFMLRQLQKKLFVSNKSSGGDYGSRRLIRFCSPSQSSRIEYLYQLAVDDYPKPSVIQVSCKNLLSYLKKPFHREDLDAADDDKTATSPNTFAKSHVARGQRLPAIKNLINMQALHQPSHLCSIPSWLKACDAQLLMCKFAKFGTCSTPNSTQSYGSGNTNDSIRIGHGQVATLESNALLSLILWPRHFGVSLRVASSFGKLAISIYGMMRLVRQIATNNGNRPCHPSFVDILQSTGPKPQLAPSSDQVWRAIRLRAFGILQNACLVAVGMPSADGKYPHGTNLLRAMLDDDCLVLTPARRSLEAMFACIINVFWHSSIVMADHRSPFIAWKVKP